MILEETEIGRDRISLARLESCANELLVQKQDPVSKLMVGSQIPGSSQFLEGSHVTAGDFVPRVHTGGTMLPQRIKGECQKLGGESGNNV